MKIILVIMLILQSKNIINTFKTAFGSKKYINLMAKEDIRLAREGRDNSDEEIVAAGMVFGLAMVVVMTIFSVVFMIMQSFYVSQLWFVILTAVLMLRRLRMSGTASKFVVDVLADDTVSKLPGNFYIGKLFSLAWLAQLGYFIYFLAITW